jgi:opacity protein-like surface antigen
MSSDRQPQEGQVPVLVNAEFAGELANGTYAVATVEPGRTFLRIGDRVLSTLSFVAAANQSYFVWVDAITGPPLVRTEVYLVDETNGRRAVAQGRFVGVAPAAVPPTAAPTPGAKPPVAREVSAPAEPERDREFALIVKAGTFKLAEDSQVVAGLASTYDTSAKSVFGIEGEWRSTGGGWALGGEVFSYKNDLVANGVSGQQKVIAVMVNGKYYFEATKRIYPFVGAGIGVAKADYSGAFTGDATGPAFQVLAGVEFRFSTVGLYLEYKDLSAKTGDSGSRVKLDGAGFLAGVVFSF